MLPYFDPTHYPEFGTGFWLGKGENLDTYSSKKVVAAIVNLMLGF